VSESPLSIAFGEVVRSRRKTVGLTQEELAERAAIHPTYVGLVERGERNPSLDVAARIANALDVTLAELIARSESGQSPISKRRRKRP
jgi:transcriptional regulator with XRE-family HTH domain